MSGGCFSVTRALGEQKMMEDVDFINVSASYDVRFGSLDVRMCVSARRSN